MQLKTFIANAVQTFMADFKRTGQSYHHKILPIDKIDNISVNVYLKFFQSSPISSIRMSLQVETDKIMVSRLHCVDAMQLYNSLLSLDCKTMDLDEVTAELKMQLSNLKFNKYNGTYDMNAQFEVEEIEELTEMQNITPSYDDCCVCHDSTLTKTDCGHHLCVQCWVSLKKMKCPICRECIKYINEESDEEDDE